MRTTKLQPKRKSTSDRCFCYQQKRQSAETKLHIILLQHTFELMFLSVSFCSMLLQSQDWLNLEHDLLLNYYLNREKNNKKTKIHNKINVFA